MAFGHAAGRPEKITGEQGLSGVPMDLQETERREIEFRGDEDFYETEHEQKAPGIRVITFRLSHEWYAAEIGGVVEVIRVGDLTEVPSAPRYIAGIYNLRGTIISVTDPKKLFDLPSEALTGKTRVIVVASGEIETGLLVDEVSRVMDVSEGQIDPPLSTLSGDKGQYVKGGIRFEDRLITMIDAAAIIEKTRIKFNGIQ
jgi:purine-binding chemotaxis protein CheW